MLSSADKKIDEFSEAFVNLSTSLDTGLGVQTTLVSLRVQSRVEELGMSFSTAKLPRHLTCSSIEQKT